MENHKMQGTFYAILFIVVVGGLGALIYYSSDVSTLLKANNTATSTNQAPLNTLNTNQQANNQPAANNQLNNSSKPTMSTPTTIPATSANARKTPEGLIIDDIEVGTGGEAQPGDLIAANYLGTLEDGTKFDSSFDRGEAFQFQLGAGNVIKGWDEGIVGMKVGGTRKLVIPAALGYGNRGAGNIIPPNATLVFLVQLVAVKGK